jgi:hypothetical protein
MGIGATDFIRLVLRNSYGGTRYRAETQTRTDCLLTVAWYAAGRVLLDFELEGGAYDVGAELPIATW